MRVDQNSLYYLLYLFKIVQMQDNGSGMRFMKRSLFYIPLISLFIATALRLGCILYRLSDLSSCVLEINDVKFDSRNDDVLLLDFEVKNCSLPANCEFVNIIIEIKSNDGTLVNVLMSPFEIEKNTPIRIRCPIKLTDIDLFGFINLKKSSVLNVNFKIKMKVRFLWVIIPLGFDYSLQLVNPSAIKGNKIFYRFNDIRVVGNLDKIRVVSRLHVDNIPKFLNINHRSVSIGSSAFQICVSPIMIQSGCLKKEITVEIQIYMNKDECVTDIMNLFWRRKKILFKIEKRSSCMLENIIIGHTFIIDHTEKDQFRVFLYDGSKNKIAFLYEYKKNICQISSIDISHVSKKLDLLVYDKNKITTNEKHLNLLKIGEGKEAESFFARYDIKNTDAKEEKVFKDIPVEIIDIRIMRGLLLLTMRISIVNIQAACMVNISPSLMILEVQLNDEVFLIPVIVTLIYPDLYLTPTLNEKQLELLFRCIYLGKHEKCKIKTVKKDDKMHIIDLVVVELSSGILKVFFDNEEIFIKDFTTLDSFEKEYLIIHELLYEDDTHVKVSSSLNDRSLPTSDILLYSSCHQFNVNIYSHCISLHSQINIKNFTITTTGEIILNVEAISSVETINIPKTTLRNIYSFILGSDSCGISFGSDLQLNLQFDNVRCTKANQRICENIKIMINEEEPLIKKGLAFAIEQQKINVEGYKGLRLVNVCRIDYYRFIVSVFKLDAINIQVSQLEITFILSQNRIGFFVSKRARIELEILRNHLYIDNISFDYEKHAFLRLCKHYWDIKERSFLKKNLNWFENEHPIKIETSFDNINNKTVAIYKMLIHRSIYETINHNFNLLEKRLKLNKNGTFVNFKLVKEKVEFKSEMNLIPFFEVEMEVQTDGLDKKDAFELEVMDKFNTQFFILKLPFKEDRFSSLNYGHLDFERFWCQVDKKFTEISSSGRLINTFLLEKMSRLLLRVYGFFFSEGIPNHNVIDIQIHRFDILNSTNSSDNVPLISLVNSRILFKIQLEDFLKKDSERSFSMESFDLDSSMVSEGQIRPHDIIKTTRNGYLVIIPIPTQDSIIQFEVNIRFLTTNSNMFVDLYEVEINRLLNMFGSGSSSFPSMFKLIFLKNNLFMLVFQQNISVSFPDYNNIYLDIREDCKIFVQLLLNPSVSIKLSKNFHILGFTSLNVLNKDLISIFKRFFGYTFIVDVNQQDDVILSTQITCNKAYMTNFAILSFSFIDIFLSSTTIFKLYVDFRNFLLFSFDFYEDEVLFDNENQEKIDEIVKFFKARINKKEEIEFD